MKRFLCILLVFMMLPPFSLAEMTLMVEKNNVTFQELDQMRTYFRDPEKWTIVYRDNLEEHLDFLISRGQTREEILIRFSEESLLWEAYNDMYPKDACFRMERFVDELSREIWHLRHFNTAGRQELLEVLKQGQLLEKYDTYSAKFRGHNPEAYIECNYTTVPPAAHESGTMQIRYINGQAYVLTYAVRDRAAGRNHLRSNAENQNISGKSPFSSNLPVKFGVELLPKLTAFALDEGYPQQAGIGDVTLTGAISKGGKLKVTLDGKEISCKVKSNGDFSVVLPLNEQGDHTIHFTATHSKYTDRTETYIINASALRTPLAITAQPEEYALAGQQTLSGTSDPGASITLQLDEKDLATLTADETGAFTHAFEVKDNRFHQLVIIASVPGKGDSKLTLPFITEYETVKEGTKAFSKNLTKHSLKTLAQDPQAHLGERVKIEVHIKEVTYIPEGLGILCNYRPSSSKQEKTPLFLTLYGYAQDQLYTGMIVTIYGTVQGVRQVNDEERMDILVEYGTYIR